MSRRSLKNISVLYIWFVSYLVILILVLGLSSIVYSISFDIIDKNTKETTEVLLDSILDKVDNSVHDSVDFINYLYLDHDLNRLIEKNTTFSQSDREDMYNIYVRLLNKSATTNSIGGIFVYIKNADMILSKDGNMTSKLYYELYYEQDNFPYDDFLAYLGENRKNSVDIITNSNGENELWVISNNTPVNERNTNSSFIMSLSEQYILGFLESSKNNDDMDILILLPNGDTLSTLSEEQQADLNGLSIDTLSNESEMSVLGDNKNFSYIQSELTSLTYIAMYSADTIAADASRIQWIMILGTVICLTVGTVTAYLMSRMNYRFMRKIMDKFGKYNRKNNEIKGNEYQWLQEESKNVISENEKLHIEKKSNEELLFRQSVQRLITLPRKINDGTIDEKIMGQLMKSNYFIAGLVYDKADNYTIERTEFRELLKHSFDSLNHPDIHANFAYMEDYFGVIFHCENPLEYRSEEFESVLYDFERTVQESSGNVISICLGDIVENVYEIHNSAKKALEASAFINSSEMQVIVWYEDIKSIPSLYEYSLSQEEKLVALLLSAECEKAKALINDILQKNINTSILSYSNLQCLNLELFNTFIRASQHSGIANQFDVFFADIEKCKNLKPDTSLKFFEDKVELFCTQIKEKEASVIKDNKLSTKIKDFINENYSDCNLNISITALHFHLTPSYLSSIFKDETGVSMLDYINTKRINIAKDLLKGDDNIANIATKTGFINSGSFIRTFKKVTGITPGQYKTKM